MSGPHFSSLTVNGWVAYGLQGLLSVDTTDVENDRRARGAGVVVAVDVVARRNSAEQLPAAATDEWCPGQSRLLYVPRTARPPTRRHDGVRRSRSLGPAHLTPSEFQDEGTSS